MRGGANSTKICRRKFRFPKSFRRVELCETLTFGVNQNITTTIREANILIGATNLKQRAADLARVTRHAAEIVQP